MKKSKKSAKSIYKKLYNECWKLMSLWVRTREASSSGYVNCVSCGKLDHYKNMQAGHYFHGKLDFDGININVQCPQCNKWKSGNLAYYTQYLLGRYGQKAMKDLFLRSNNFKKYSLEELEEIKKSLTEELKPKELCL